MTPPQPARPELIERLLEPAAYPHPTSGIRLVETHLSWVILTGPFAYKLKKPVRLGFVDYGTLALRRASCDGEVRVSGRFAPGIYLGAVPVTGSTTAPRIDGPGEAIEWAVKLVQFDEADRLDARFDEGRLSAADGRALGAAIAAVEAQLPVAKPGDRWGSPESVLAAATVNLATIRHCLPEAAARADALGHWLSARLEAARPLLAARLAAGRVRECHGDLHLANIVLHDGRMTPFDAIEFDDNLRWIDVANDVAFLSMDLQSRGRSDLAAQVVSSWAEAADDHGALAVMPVYEAYRAIVRASIAAIRAGEGDRASRAEALRYLDLAERLRVRPPAVMVVTCGISGSGKSTVAAELVGAIGALRIRSDAERKRLAGMRWTDRPADAATTAALYGDAFTRRVYERLAGVAGSLLAAGASVVVDAACTRRWQRDLLAAVAVSCGAPLLWVAFDPEAEAIEARVAARAARGDDPSDATAEVVRDQRAAFEPVGDDEIDPRRESRVGLVRVAAAEGIANAAAVARRVVEARDRLVMDGDR